MGLIESIEFNNSDVIRVEDGEIIVFVGSNNVGKSQCLKDIYSLAENQELETTVVKHVSFRKPSNEELMTALEKHCRKINYGDYQSYESYSFSINTYALSCFPDGDALSSMRSFLISYLSTEDRLQLANPAMAINQDETPSHPIHYLAINPSYKIKLSSYFERAFKQELLPHVLFGREIPLCIGASIPSENNYADLYEALEVCKNVLNGYDQVQDQGDGIRSFVGITLNLMLENYGLFLLDEPESFLHPPQARIMGEIIGEMSSQGKQILVSTHSKDVVQGLIEACPDRVRIIRITRNGDKNKFCFLENDTIASIMKDPLLRYSDILNSMFHESVVLCEGDSDCQMYSAILDHIKEQEGTYAQTQFIHCGGKGRLARTVDTLESLGVNYRVIADLDILKEREKVRSLVESCKGDWSEIEHYFSALSSSLRQSDKTPISKLAILEMLGETLEENLTATEVGQLKDLLKSQSSIWGELKSSGVDALPTRDDKNSFEKINQHLIGIGLHVVTVGELESFVPDIKKHGSAWVNKVLETYPDLSDGVYDRIRAFVRSWNL